MFIFVYRSCYWELQEKNRLEEEKVGLLSGHGSNIQQQWI